MHTNFFHAVKAGVAIPAQSLTSAAATDMVAVSEPWRIGRQITFILVGGAIASSGQLAVAVQGLLRADGTTWEALKQKDGTTALVFPAAKLGDTDEIEKGLLMGTLPLSRIDNETYKAIRIVPTESGGGASLISAAYVISDLVAEASGQTDELFSLVF